MAAYAETSAVVLLAKAPVGAREPSTRKNRPRGPETRDTMVLIRGALTLHPFCQCSMVRLPEMNHAASSPRSEKGTPRFKGTGAQLLSLIALRGRIWAHRIYTGASAGKATHGQLHRAGWRGTGSVRC